MTKIYIQDGDPPPGFEMNDGGLVAFGYAVVAAVAGVVGLLIGHYLW